MKSNRKRTERSANKEAVIDGRGNAGFGVTGDDDELGRKKQIRISFKKYYGIIRSISMMNKILVCFG